MTTPIHMRSQEANRPAEKVNTPQVRETEFACLLQKMTEKKPASREERIQRAVSEASARYNLPPALLKGVIKQESGFNPQAVSSCGAQGCMQLMPETARDMGVRDSFNIEQNIDGGSKYLRQMMDQFGGDTKLALAAYNSGPGNVQKYNGVPPFAETQNYVKSVLAHTESFGGTGNTAEFSAAKLDRSLLASAVVNAALASNPLNLPVKTPKIGNSDEPPPPPPPRGMRV